MINKRFFLALIFSFASHSQSNPIMERFFNELYFGSNGWILEFHANALSIRLDECLLATRTDTAGFIVRMEIRPDNYVVITPDSLDHRIDIHPYGDTLSLLDLGRRHLDEFSFSSIPVGYSLNRLGSYLTYLDSTPTIGTANDTSGAMGWIQGSVTDETGHPLGGVQIYWEYYFATMYFANTDSLGWFRFRAMAGNVHYYFNLNGFNPCMKPIMAYPDCTIVTNIIMEKNLDAIESGGSGIWPGLSLWDNYPNPFNSITRFQYSIPSDGFTDVEVFDVRGKPMETLFRGFQKRGEYRLFWDAFEAPSGIYFCRLQSGHSILTKKWILIR
jgi:hypothetical protein